MFARLGAIAFAARSKTKRDILEYTKRQNEAQLIEEEDYQEIVETLEDLEDNTIICINYDNGMGMTFDWWKDTDKLEMEVE